tara:strand:- start:269 stop:643 length:375 start_codon:yes stop_codon:yes gene_type:complete
MADFSEQMNNLLDPASVVRPGEMQMADPASVVRPGEMQRLDDINLIQSYMKMLDPRSIVREGELMQTRPTGGPADYLISAVQSLKGGGSLAQAERESIAEKMLNLANKLSPTILEGERRIPIGE